MLYASLLCKSRISIMSVFKRNFKISRHIASLCAESVIPNRNNELSFNLNRARPVISCCKNKFPYCW